MSVISVLSRRNLEFPITLRPCHTAEVDGYIVEGHIPAAVIERLLRDRPKGEGLRCPGNAARFSRDGAPSAGNVRGHSVRRVWTKRLRAMSGHQRDLTPARSPRQD
ncbi:MAG: DUF411 domain-containing protein [Rhodoplanes sp.]